MTPATPAPRPRAPRSHTRAALVIVALAAITALASACPRRMPKPDDAITDPAELLAAVEAATADVTSVRMKDMRLDYYGEEGRVSIRQLILLSKPDKVRIQTYIPGLDGVAGVLACACGRFAYHDRSANVYYYGDASAENVARVMPVGLSCADLNSLLLGGLPAERLRNEAGAPLLTWDDQTGRYALTFPLKRGPHKGGKLLAQVTHGTWRLMSLTVQDRAGTPRFEYTTLKTDRFGALTLPTARRFVTADERDDISMRGDTIQLNPELPETLFGLAAPSGSALNYVGEQLPPPRPPADGDLCAADTP